MKLSAKVEYAFKAVLELSLRYNGEQPIQINTISQSQGIPKKFLIQLLIHLKNSKIVNSARGVTGGYYLTRVPAKITFAEVVNAVDNNMLDDYNSSRTHVSPKTSELMLCIWGEINEKFIKNLREIDFEHLVKRIKKEQLTYCI